VGASDPVPNSSRLKGRNAAACRVTLIDCARIQGIVTGAAEGLAAFGGCSEADLTSVMLGIVSLIVAMVCT